jgi:uncharacterized phiE125 gp8 family phage protein
MKYFISESATFAPVSVADLKAHLFLFDDDSYDAELSYILLSAQDIVTDLLGEHISSTTIQCNLSSFEDTVLPHRNVLDLASVEYYDTTDTLVELDNANYYLDATGKDAKVKFTSKPSTSSKYDNPVVVTYEAGMNVVPQVLAQAVLIVSAELFEVRSETITIQKRKAMSVATTLLMKYRRW